ncbi:MAG: alpha/beta hydrolase domain-containing protein [Dehalococcoidia bacterium]
MPVTGFELRSREPYEDGRPFGDVGPYERIEGRLLFAVDPTHEANREIVDLDRAPRDPEGRVQFAADVTILTPADPARGNRRMLQDVVNRGGRTHVAYNLGVRDASRPAWVDPGDGFLQRRGWTMVSVGWQWDVPRGTGLVGLEAPEALEDGHPIEGWVMITHQLGNPTDTVLLADRAHEPLVAADIEQPNASMTVRDYPDAPRQEIARDRWRFARVEDRRTVADPTRVTLEGGFEPGRIYEIVYRTNRSPIVGAGLLAFRDAATFFRHESNADGNPLAGRIDHTFSIGISQSGRFLRTFLYHGMNRDEAGRQAFDGLHIHIAGARRGEFNHRYAQPSVQYTYGFGHLPPHSYEDATDPVTGASMPGLLSRQRAAGGVPRIVATNSAAEYWRADASMLHIDPTGTRDLADPPEARAYLFSATQHSAGAARLTDTPPTGGARGAHYLNVTHYGTALRAALVNLEAWVVDGVEPPSSRVPRLEDGSAVPRQAIIEAFSNLPGATVPVADRLLSLRRLDLGNQASEGVGEWPAEAGEAFPTFVSAVDADGNELAGIRLPDVEVPLATLAGWNPRNAASGGPGQILPMMGSTLPFPQSKADRERTNDPRASIEERYRDRDDFLAQVRAAATRLAEARLILEEDIVTCVDNAAARWDLLVATPVA